ncbi:hypothetical protein VRC02_19720 [Erwinia sp. E_sp_B01_3]|uniref:hypothetical protein n=1 Tax=unclassified Erwinia TaxID=2622719 RepID=UPI0030D06C9A
MSETYVFLIKGEVIVPQDLEENEAGEMIRSMLVQGFTLSHLHIHADGSTEAIKRFNKYKKMYKADVIKEVIQC